MNKKQGGNKVQLTVKIKLLPTTEQEQCLVRILSDYIKMVNSIVTLMVAENKMLKLTSKDIKENLPSAVKNQAIQDGKSVYKKYKKTKIQSVLKKPMCIWNNQNYTIKENYISFPIMINGKSNRINVKAIISERQRELLANKLGTLRITKKSNKWIAQVAVQIDEPSATGCNVMGVDLGLKVSAVAVTEEYKTRFFGNGRENKYMKRKFKAKRKELGKDKKLNAIRNLNDKEQRWMKDKDHKISRAIVNFAKQNKVSIIRLEKLANIRNSAKTSRKNEKNLHTWSFYRLAQFIEYKALLEGIRVEYVNPQYTSQKCPVCSKLNHAKDRNYSCECGFKMHRDRLGAINIINATVIDGNSLSA